MDFSIDELATDAIQKCHDAHARWRGCAKKHALIGAMAIWQADMYLLPRESLCRMGYSVGSRVPDQVLGSVNWWDGFGTPAAVRPDLARIAPRLRGWSPDWELFGDEEGNRIDLLLSAGEIEEIGVRFDVRSLDYDFIDGVAELAQRWDCLLLAPTLTVLEPKRDLIVIELRARPSAFGA